MRWSRYLSLLVVTATSAAAQSPLKFGTIVWPTRAAPGRVELGDFDRDGALDALVSTPSTLDVLAGDGGGGFEAPRALLQGCVPNDFDLVDLDSDGWLDLVLIDCGGLSVYRSDHAGGVLPAQIVGGSEFGDVESADFNGDGALDLVAWDGVQRAAVVFLAQGASFAPPLVHPLGIEYPGALRCGDVDGDGRVDLALASRGWTPWESRVVVARGLGDGTFGERWAFDAWYADDVALGDLEGDGADELLPRAPGGLSSVTYLGAGRFESRELSERTGVSVRLVDFDLDGDLDIVRPGWTAAVEGLVNDGAGNFLERRVIHSCAAAIDGTLGDLDGDHAPDFVATRYGSGLSVTLATHPGVFAARQPVAVPWNPVPVVGDVDGDGVDDLLTIGVDGHFETYANDGLADFELRSRGRLPASTYWTQLVDFDGDGDRDWVGRLEDATQRVFACANDGHGHFASAVVTPIAALGDDHFGDVDGDGRIDLVVVEHSIRVHLGDGAGGFGAPITSASAQNPFAAKLGDVDGDGRADLVYAAPASQIEVQLGRSDGSFAPPMTTAVGNFVETLALGEFDGDGRLDVAFVTESPPQLVRARGDGAGGFHSFAAVAIDSFFFGSPQLAVARFDRDALDDVAVLYPWWMEGDYSRVEIRAARTASGFDAGTELDVPWYFERLAVGDFDGDGRVDLVTQNDASRRIELLLQR